MRTKLVLSRIALVVGGLIVGLFSAEVALRIRGTMPEYYWTWHDAIVELDPHVLYRFRGHSRADLNALGYRDYEFSRERNERARILMLGDSFQFGDNVEADQTIPKALERELGSGYEVFNMGIPGYGPDQSYAQLLKEGLDFKPDAVVLSIFAGNDFNDIVKNRLYTRTKTGLMRYNPSNPVAVAIPAVRTTILFRRLLTGHGLPEETVKSLNPVLGGDKYDVMVDFDSQATRRRKRLMRGVLRLFKGTLGEHGIDFYVFIIPSEQNIQNDRRFKKWSIPAEAYFNNEKIADEICRAEQLRFVNLAGPMFSKRGRIFFTPREGHLSERGTHFAAERVARMIRQELSR